MKKYVLGFILNERLTRVLLLRKNRPKWQEGRLNGIGGKLGDNNVDETPLEAMVRECKEETGLKIPNFVNYAILKGNGFEMHIFYAVTDDIYDCKQIEDEELGIYSLKQFDGVVNYDWYQFYSRMNNIDFLIPMALNNHLLLDKHFSDGKATKFIIEEI